MSIRNDVGVSDAKVKKEVVVGSEHEVSHRVTRPRSRKGKSRRPDEDLTEIQVQKLIAKFEIMSAFNPIHTISKLPVGIEKTRGEAGPEVKIVSNIHRN